MGVPAFFKWLSLKYPKIIQNAYIDDFNKGLELTSRRPNGYFDCLYFDLNGIIHTCCHQDNKPKCATEELAFELMCENIDKIVKMVLPEKLIYFAIDGVAPRAKLNQQRMRRYRSSYSMQIENDLYAEISEDFKKKFKAFPEKQIMFDGNSISPGTVFLQNCSKAIFNFIQHKLSSDPIWQKVVIIFSDANVPGEGEHKIMDFIRSQRSHLNYDPNMRHCFYGNDADLIMLGLATHEVNFYILRECTMSKYEIEARNKVINPNNSEKNMLAESDFKPHQFVHLNILREYLEKELLFDKNISLNFERCLDDFILMCFFVGNDFLPHLPSLTIYLGSIDQLIFLYQNVRLELGDYLTNNGEINIQPLLKFISFIGKIEENIFRNSLNRERAYEQRKMQLETIDNKSSLELATQSDENILDSTEKDIKEFNKILAEKRVLQEQKNIISEKVVLGEGNWRKLYYTSKFRLDEQDLDNLNNFADKVSQFYIDGLRWVLHYYFQGILSWDWYYPFHYAPFAKDLGNCKNSKIFKFQKGLPLEPYQQLLCVLPPQNSKYLPESFEIMMTSNNSPIRDFYPNTFMLDPNGKKMAWQYIPLLPFIDVTRLKTATANIYVDPKDEIRNSCKHDIIITSKYHPFSQLIAEVQFNNVNQICLASNLSSYKLFGFIHNFTIPYINRNSENYQKIFLNKTIENRRDLSELFFVANITFTQEKPHVSELLILPEKNLLNKFDNIVVNDRHFNSGNAKRMIYNLLNSRHHNTETYSDANKIYSKREGSTKYIESSYNYSSYQIQRKITTRERLDKKNDFSNFTKSKYMKQHYSHHVQNTEKKQY